MPPSPLTQPHISIGGSRSMDTGSVDPGLMWGPMLAPVGDSTTCKSPPHPTPVISVNTPVFRCPSVTPSQVTPVTRVKASEVSSLHTPRPKLALVVASITCKPTPQATPLISVNTPVFRCSSVTPGQVTPATKVNAPEVPARQPTEAPAVIQSSPSVNTQANLNECNNSFKGDDCSPAYPPDTAISSSSKAVSTLLSTAPVLQVASLSCPFHQPQVLTAQASALSRPPRHLPDHMTVTSGIPVTSPTQQPSLMLCLPHHPPDHVTST